MVARYSATPLACRASSAMTRWNTGSLGTTVGSAALVADAEIITRPASCKAGSTALVSPENAGPTMPITLLSLMKRSLTVVACAGSPAVSNSFMEILVPPAALASSRASLMPSRMFTPRLALSPV